MMPSLAERSCAEPTFWDLTFLALTSTALDLSGALLQRTTLAETNFTAATLD